MQLYKMHICRPRFFLEVIFVISYILWTVPAAELKCGGLESPFDILPEGDSAVEFGSALQLFCKLNTSHPNATGRNARDLYFYIFEGENKVNLPNITVVNDTTIRMDLVSPPLGSKYYYCALKNTVFVCPTAVHVGYKPQPVLNFQCTSYNWERLFCNWTPPANPIKTEYRLKFSLTGRAGRIPRPCPDGLDIKNNSCKFDHGTDPSYRQPYPFYSFEIIGKNPLGNLSTSILFNHYEHVIPNKPENVTVVNKTVGSAVIGWDVPYPLFHFPPGLRFKIEYKNEWEDWVVANDPNIRIYGKNQTYNITGLKYSHTAYDIRLYLKSRAAQPGPNFWSEPSSTTFVTPSTIPSMAPQTTQGIFDVVSSGNDTDVFIYWKRIPKKFKNGANFSYSVICTKDNGEDCGPPTEKMFSFAKFPFNSLHSYIFNVYSINEVGRSVNNSYVYVPKYESTLQPESFTKVAYDQGVYELSWKPVTHRNLSHYTIFWCEEDKDLPLPCKGYLDWVIVPKDTISRNITMKHNETKFYKFAIAATLGDGTSSGMVWSACVIFHDKVLKKVDDFHISRIGSREVDVVWEIRCAQSSAFKGFAFYYCPVAFSTQDNNCEGNMTEEIRKLNGSQERNITLTDLKPYTTYKLQISIISLDGSQQIQLGPRSVPKRFITLEDAPSVPLSLSAKSVTNNSVTLTWVLPKEMNGILRTYILHFRYFGGENETGFAAKNVSDNSIINMYHVQNLASFTTYNFTLKVCTDSQSAKCSNYSEPAVVTTNIGVPGKMMRPHISIVNSSADVSWELPVPSSGHLDYYELLISDFRDVEIFNLTGSRAKLLIQACNVKYKTVQFRIRAINVDNNNNNTYYGPWSESTEVHCGSSVGSEHGVLIVWILISFAVLTTSVCSFYLVKKGWLQCRKMKDVEVKLPSGLDYQDPEKDNMHLSRWSPRSPETVTGSVGTVLAPDEEYLLNKKSDESIDNPFNMPVKSGGDSSGVSVGRGSVSSSITSDTHISSDSGAEADQGAVTSTAFENWDSGRKNLNNVNVNPSSKDVLNFRDFDCWNLNEPSIPGYTKVGFKNGFVPEKNLPGKGYVTIGSVAPLNPLQKVNCNLTDFTSHAEDPLSLDSESESNNSTNEQSTSAPKYVTLAHFEEQRKKESPVTRNMFAGDRSVPAEQPKLSRLDESSERDDEKTEDSIEGDFSGNETETETIHEVPVSRNMGSMPPYISMIDNPGSKTPDSEEEIEDEDEEEANSEEEDKLSNGTIDLSSKKTVNEIDSVLVDKGNKENESFSGYIPHHLFGKGSVHT